MAMNGDVATKERILNAARELFAEKGYDGASMADIAKRAGVNKALTFYYFENKHNLLIELMKKAGKEMLELKDVLMRGSKPFVKESIEEYFELIMNRMESREEMVRIVLSESLKETDSVPPLFEFMEPIAREAVTFMQGLGITVDNPGMTATAEIFFDAMPLLTFAVLGRKWAEYSGNDYSRTRDDFFSLFKSIYIGYIYRKYFNESR